MSRENKLTELSPFPLHVIAIRRSRWVINGEWANSGIDHWPINNIISEIFDCLHVVLDILKGLHIAKPYS